MSGPDPFTRLVASPAWARTAPWPANAHVDDWFRDHARRLADAFVGPLLERHRAAAAADWPAVRNAWRLDRLDRDAEQAADDVVAATLDAYDHLARQVIARRRLGLRGRRAAAIPPATRLALRRAAEAAGQRLQPYCAALRNARDRDGWDAAVQRLDAAWADAWDELGDAVGWAWRDALGPGLERLDALRPGAPRWILPAILAVIAAAAIAVWVLL